LDPLSSAIFYDGMVKSVESDELKRAIWNNKTDEGKLFDAADTQVSIRRYTAPPPV
jgi:hypothetical protein